MSQIFLLVSFLEKGNYAMGQMGYYWKNMCKYIFKKRKEKRKCKRVALLQWAAYKQSAMGVCGLHYHYPNP